jgi:transcriptional regulator with XRE-family HTH domain
MMTGKEFRGIRKALNLTMDDFALELGFCGNISSNRRTIHRFETEIRPVPYGIAKLAWLLSLRPGNLPDWPKHLIPEQSLEGQGEWR